MRANRWWIIALLALTLGGGPVYLTMINIGDERKNYADILSAFLLAFGERPDVTLVVKLVTNRLREHHAQVWLVNTGWTGGAYGVGKRISLKNTRAIIDAIHDGALGRARIERDPVFGFDAVTECPGVPADILLPRDAWNDKTAYDAIATRLASLFRDNFRKYESSVSEEIKAALAA